MVRSNVTVKMSGGLETRPIAMLVQLASQFQSRVHLESGTKSVNAKSIMGMMTLGIDNGDDVIVTAEGPDEKEAVEKLLSFLGQNS
ncbi:MAG: HPr family phosphocarrier protein [Eubacterium sp.]|nr:HPr family phosphocarrier protein [Eubacterium sp.]